PGGKEPRLGEGKRVLSVALSPDGRYLAIGGYQQQPFTVWDLDAGHPLPAFALDRKLDRTKVWAMAFSSNGECLAVGSAQPTVWEVPGGRLARTLPGTSNLRCASIAFSPDGERVAATYQDGLVRVWYRRNGRSALAPRKQTDSVPAAVFCPSDG